MKHRIWKYGLVGAFAALILAVVGVACAAEEPDEPAQPAAARAAAPAAEAAFPSARRPSRLRLSSSSSLLRQRPRGRLSSRRPPWHRKPLAERRLR